MPNKRSRKIIQFSIISFVSVVYTVESWPWGTRMCMMSEFMKDFSTGVSVFTLVAMSFDRFVAIVNPLRRFQGSGKFQFFRSNNRINENVFILIHSILYIAENHFIFHIGYLYFHSG